MHANLPQSCPTLSDPMDCSPPGSSVHGILQARTLAWVAISFSRGSSQPRDRTHVSWSSCTVGRFFTTEPLEKPNIFFFCPPFFLCLDGLHRGWPLNPQGPWALGLFLESRCLDPVFKEPCSRAVTSGGLLTKCPFQISSWTCWKFNSVRVGLTWASEGCLPGEAFPRKRLYLHVLPTCTGWWDPVVLGRLSRPSSNSCGRWGDGQWVRGPRSHSWALRSGSEKAGSMQGWGPLGESI